MKLYIYRVRVSMITNQRESPNQRESLLAIFSYIICKDTVNEDSMPVVPPSCRAAVVCKE